jgi:hypothetical protein
MTKIFHISSLLFLVSLSSASFTSQLDPFFPDSVKDTFEDFINGIEAFERDIFKRNQQFDEFTKKSDSQIEMLYDKKSDEVHVKIFDVYTPEAPKASYENNILKIFTSKESQEDDFLLIHALFNNNLITVDVQQRASHNTDVTNDNSTQKLAQKTAFSHIKKTQSFAGTIDFSRTVIDYDQNAHMLLIRIPQQNTTSVIIPVNVNIAE